MRVVLLVMLLICAADVDAAAPPCSISDSASRECFAERDLRTIRAYRRELSRTERSLEIKAANGASVTFVSNPDGENYETHHSYFVLGVLTVGRLVVLIDLRYEGRNVYLVSLIDGAVYDVDGMPKVSPDGKRLLVHSMDIDANYDSNFIAIYLLEGSALKREFVLDGDADSNRLWGPEQVRWVSSSEIAFTRTTHASTESGYASEPWRLLRSHSTWIAKPAT